VAVLDFDGDEDSGSPASSRTIVPAGFTDVTEANRLEASALQAFDDSH
jgi:hypothetical protein